MVVYPSESADISKCEQYLFYCIYTYTAHETVLLTQVRAGELSLCYEAVAAVYPAIIARYPLNLPPPKPPRKEMVVTLLPQGKRIGTEKVKSKEDGEEREEKDEEEKEKEKNEIQREDTDSMNISLYNTQ